VGLVMHRVSAMWLVFSSSLACAGAPLLMALIDPAWPYWYAAFPAQVLHPVCFHWGSWPSWPVSDVRLAVSRCALLRRPRHYQ